MVLPTAEIMIEDRRSVAAFLDARLHAAQARPSRNVLHDLVVAITVGHRRAQRALSLVFEGTEDAQLKRSILRRYAILDRSLVQVEQGLDAMEPGPFLDMSHSIIESIDGGFQFAYAHIDDVRNALPEVDHLGDTRPAKPRDPDGTTTEVWFGSSRFADDEGTTMRFGRQNITRRGH